MENEPKQPTELELLKSQERRALEEHESLRKALENNPKDPELRVSVDRAYDHLKEIQRKIEQVEGRE